ncbi:chemotaxis protein CheD [Mangrovibacillus cuniculi]|uniref:Probable chemoreceptor glutamine deamidase CheD n=1 Tax=Mangrovibacillus cuniculi TaxID=2593652 RepID=A0A7S8CAF1_9BACI|nr:chemotaxis protein CheD [Mangrovibacillus cuniculi]QPC46367.1 chemotaxis protein CheD [Mangrovibacillus cuniculi]
MNDVTEVVKVGIAAKDFAKPPQTIRTSGLGSCVGIILYDDRQKVAGLAHVMLPDSSLANGSVFNEAKFADTAIYDLLLGLEKLGASRSNIKAKMAGGAQMFQFTTKSDLMRIGPRNVEILKLHLERTKIPLVAEDTGGNSGRTIDFDPASTILTIRTVNKGTSEL